MKLYVDLKEHGYPIYIERGILDQAAEKIREVLGEWNASQK